MNPPTIHTLLKEPEFRAMMKRAPRIPEPLSFGRPWRVWALTTEGKWATREYVTYAAAWEKFVPAVRDRERYRDVAIVSKRIFLPPPASLPDTLLSTPYSWCSRCRRPSLFKTYTATHHALRLQPTLTDDEPYRCFYCGIRLAALPRYTA